MTGLLNYFHYLTFSITIGWQMVFVAAANGKFILLHILRYALTLVSLFIYSD
jgi:hypothetical protein